MSKFHLTLILLFSLISATSAQTLTPQEKAVFDDIAYHRRKTGEYAVISKWTTPIKYKVYGDAENFLLKEIDSTFSQLQRLTKLDISKTTDDDEANFIFFIGAKNTEMISPNMRKYLNTAGGSQYRINKNFEIFRVENVVMPEKYTYKQSIRFAIKKHIVRYIGFFKSTALVPSSLFYNANNDKLKIDEFDSNIIKALYHPEIKPGMTKDEVDKILAH